MDAHAAFLAALRERPEDDAPRRIYADWLEEQGGSENEARAAFLRLEVELARAPADGVFSREMGPRLRELAAEVDPGWLAAAARSPVESCGLAFLFRCPKRWDRLKPTEDGRVRFCEGCGRSVYYCVSITQANRHALAGHCVAIAPNVRRADGDLRRPVPSPGRMTLGLLVPPTARRQPAATSPGERVVILDGTFADMDGPVSRVDPRTGHVFVALSIFGHTVTVELQPWQIRPAG